MNGFKDFKIFHKIMLILVVYALALVINLFIGRASLLETQNHLIDLEETIYDSVQLSSVNRPLLRRADELLTQAVSFGEEDLKLQGEESLGKLLKNLEQLKQVDANRIDTLQGIESNVLAYRDLAVPIVNDMLHGQPDFSQLQTKVQEKAKLFEQTNEALAAYHEEIDQVFKKTIHMAVESGENSLFTTSLIGALFFILIAVLITYIARSISKTASSLSESLHELAEGEGDLSHRIVVASGDELGSTAGNFNSFMEKLSRTVKSIVSEVNPLLEASSELDRNSGVVQSATSELLSKAHEGKTSMSEIDLSISEISQSATLASDAMQTTDQEANQGLQIVQSTIDNSKSLNTKIISASELAERLAQDTENVANILDVISTIAEQTNLLALNAAIEAARAGEQGRGFAVVADEVRALASKTADATTEIRDVLERLENTADETVDAMNMAKDQSLVTERQAEETGEALNKIKASIEEVNSMSLTIASATEEQSIVVGNVSEIINNMYQAAETTEHSYQELASVAKKLVHTSDALNQASSQFKL